MQEAIESLCYESDTLTVVHYLYADDMLEAVSVQLSFTNVAWLVEACGEDDTIAIRKTDGEIGSLHSFDVSSYLPWSAAVNKLTRWVWRLTNQQGYDDALQFEFADPDKGGTVCIQLLTIASRLDVSTVLKVETPRHPKLAERLIRQQ